MYESQTVGFKQLEVEDREIFMRCDMAPEADCVYQYTPARLTDQQIAEGVLKRGAAGAFWMDKMQSLEDLEHIMIKPVKPKAYLAAHTTLEPGLKYKLG